MGEKKLTGTRTQDLSFSVKQLNYRATWLTFELPPCLIEFVPESALNNSGTTTHALFNAHCPSRESTLSHQMSWEEKIVTRPGL